MSLLSSTQSRLRQWLTTQDGQCDQAIPEFGSSARAELEIAASDAAAQSHLKAIRTDAPWLTELDHQIDKIMMEAASARSKFRHLRTLADRIVSVATPHSACRHGCHHCCHIAVPISSLEAVIIGSEIGRNPQLPQTSDNLIAEERLDSYRGKPCPFLSDGRCSIYSSRPLACRLQFNVGASDYFCDLRIPSEESRVYLLRFDSIWAAMVFLAPNDTYADIRDYFHSEGISHG
jgi:Fe-S-cluster containining protein